MDETSSLALVFWGALGLAAVAAAIALAGRYRNLPGWLLGGAGCDPERGCATLFRSPTAAVLGLPNGALGLALDLLLAAGRLSGWPPAVLLTLVAPAVAMSAWLAWRLVRERLVCRVCWAAHAANLLLALVLAAETIGW